MKRNLLQKNHLYILGLLLALVGLVYFVTRESAVPQESTYENKISNIAVTETLKKDSTESVRVPPKEDDTTALHFILGIGDDRISIPFYSGETLYDALMRARENKSVSFSGKEYTGLGFFISDIGNLHQGNGKYLLFFINNEEAMVGISSYVLKDGDEILWKLK